ncbi:hypothetical protein [Roseibium polysiphoniae]|uniref:Uncharacterized protein n=1 Tax=Roseibium polysiphoniae TaxID=2571221 RepID=A0A944CHC4_9HYPH|nr:hypothetical protein [Roseibium polysiphoniae]MBS8262276.1 hypothetical protein [Roseibium polysiphoniae]
MRGLKTSVAALALTAFAVSPALACEWSKSAKAKTKMTVAQTTEVPEVAIATNDLPVEVTSNITVIPKLKSDAAK